MVLKYIIKNGKLILDVSFILTNKVRFLGFIRKFLSNKTRNSNYDVS